MYVCTEFGNKNLITKEVPCKNWVELELPKSAAQTVLPTLTNADRDAILLWMVGIFATVFVVKRISRMFGS